MKTRLFLIVLSMIALAGISHAQQASEGKAVVTHGFENSKKVRFAVLRPYEVGQYLIRPILYPPWWEPVDSGYVRVDSLIDSLGVTATEDWPAVTALKPFYDNQKVICAGGPYDAGTLDTNLNGLAWATRQRVYTPSPNPIFGDELGEHHFRYNAYFFDSAHAAWHDNTYDTNDVNPYTEYPAYHTYVVDTFRTLRYPGTDSLVYYGNEGRVVLGYSDDRNASDLLTTPNFYLFQTHPPHSDTAKAFSVNLEFWADTTTGNIDMSKASTSNADSVPLIRLQVLYKKPGQSVLPFVPFQTSADTTQPGWYKCLDTVVSRATYNSLSDDWRTDDSTFVGTTGQRAYNWRFKQLHAIITLSQGMIDTAKNHIDDGTTFGPTNNSPVDFGVSNNPANPTFAFDTSSYLHPDSMVNYGSPDKTNPLIEIRVLSTYRTKVRVRDVTYQDTMVDRYLNRRRFHDTVRNIDTTHSVEQNGTYGGNDDEVNAALNAFAILLDTNRPRELMYNDNGGSPGEAFPMMGYLDYMASKYNINVHTRPQDAGNESEVFRRSRLSLDGQPPSVFENQLNRYGANYLPLDYVYYGLKYDTASPWGSSHFDTTMGLVIVRRGTDTDTLKAYHLFELYEAAQSNEFNFIRSMNRVALWHPWSKRFATEYSIKSFSDVTNGAYDSLSKVVHLVHRGGGLTDTMEYTDSVYYRGYYDATLGQWVIPEGYGYTTPPLTSEMITTSIYGSFASGGTAVSAAEAFGNAGDDVGTHDMGPFSPAPHSDSSQLAYAYTHDYNVGHYYTCRQWPLNDTFKSDMDGPLPNYYLGMSNTYRAYLRSIGRLNAIWSVGDHPVKNFRWLDSYSQYGATDPTRNFPFMAPGDVGLGDFIARSNAFLKVVRTVGVNPWERNPDSSYIDLALSDSDADTATEAIVGLFIDSISGSQKNYAALVVNPRCWPGRDTADLNYYNAGLDSISKRYPTLGDIDVRKVYMKLDLTKTDPTFQGNSYYVVRDLWHPDSTWLLNKDSTLAVYIKPGDAKFLYFEKGIAIDAAAKTGTDTGQTTSAEFCFNNGRRVAEIEHGTRDVITYTRNNKLYVATPAAGSTFGASPDESSGDNIITGNELALDTVHLNCARPSVSTAQNDTGVALTYWFEDALGAGHIAAAYRASPDSLWHQVTYTGLQIFDDSSYDYRWSTPVITPINDTAWLIAAGNHPVSFSFIGFTGIVGLIFVTPPHGTPYFTTASIPMANDAGGDTMSYAAYPTLTSRPMADSLWPVRFAYQQGTSPTHRDIFFKRWKGLMGLAPTFDTIANVSQGLEACDNIHPSLALNGTVELARWLLGGFTGNAKFYHDNLAWETSSSPGSYNPVVRARHQVDSPLYNPHPRNFWGAYNVFSTGGGPYHYPEIAAESRTYNGRFAFPSDSSHDWIRLVYAFGEEATVECWSPNWLRYRITETSFNPSLPQTTNNPDYWPDSGSVPRSIAWIQDLNTQSAVRVTNGYVPRITNSYHPNLLLEPAPYPCDTPVFIGPSNLTIIAPSGPPVLVNWDPVNLSSGDADEAWANPENIPNVEHTDAFAIQACDSILIPRATDTTGLTEMQDSLKSGLDYVMFRMKLLRKSDSSWLATIDSMIVTKTTTYWAGAFFGINPTMARYEVPCTASPDSAFVSMEVLRGDTTNSIRRYYVNFMDTVAPVAALKQAEKPQSIPGYDSMIVSVYPNPANSMVHIQAGPFPPGLHAYVEIVNEMGTVVATPYDGIPSGEMGVQLELNCSEWPSGTYYIHVVNGIMGQAVKLQLIK